MSLRKIFPKHKLDTGTHNNMKKYKIEHGWLTWSATVEIDKEKAMPVIKEMVEFWSAWEDLLEANDGNYIDAFLQQLGRRLMYNQIGFNRSVEGAIENLASMEGWCKMDGSQGIRLIEIDSCSFEHDEFEFVEIVDK